MKDSDIEVPLSHVRTRTHTRDMHDCRTTFCRSWRPAWRTWVLAQLWVPQPRSSSASLRVGPQSSPCLRHVHTLSSPTLARKAPPRPDAVGRLSSASMREGKPDKGVFWAAAPPGLSAPGLSSVASLLASAPALCSASGAIAGARTARDKEHEDEETEGGACGSCLADSGCASPAIAATELATSDTEEDAAYSEVRQLFTSPRARLSWRLDLRAPGAAHAPPFSPISPVRPPARGLAGRSSTLARPRPRDVRARRHPVVGGLALVLAGATLDAGAPALPVPPAPRPKLATPSSHHSWPSVCRRRWRWAAARTTSTSSRHRRAHGVALPPHPATPHPALPPLRRAHREAVAARPLHHAAQATRGSMSRAAQASRSAHAMRFARRVARDPPSTSTAAGDRRVSSARPGRQKAHHRRQAGLGCRLQLAPARA